MKRRFYYDQFKHAFKKSIEQYEDSADFIDGLALGSLLARETHQPDLVLNLFKEWKNYAKEEEINDRKKRVKYYLTNFSTYFTAKDFDEISVKYEQKIRKRDSKLEAKQKEDETVSSHSNQSDGTSDIKQEVSDPKEQNQSETSENLSKRLSASNFDDSSADIKHSENTSKKKESKICSICRNPGRNWISLIDCGHFVHEGCLKNHMIQCISNLKYETNCRHENCNKQITRDDIYNLLPDLTKYSYDVLEFIDKLEKHDPDLTTYWCFRCRSFSIYRSGESSRCKNCNKNQDVLKTMFSLIKKIILNIKSEDKEDNSKEMMMKCLEDFHKNVIKCDYCSNWKQKLCMSYMRCICH